MHDIVMTDRGHEHPCDSRKIETNQTLIYAPKIAYSDS
jgi:hypothetical protein